MSSTAIPLAKVPATSSIHTTSLSWYDCWLDKQLKTLPPAISERLQSPLKIPEEIARFCKPETSVDDIANHLLSLGLIESNETEDEGRHVARSIAFAILGWQTMLYEPAFGTCPPQQMAIEDVLDGYTGQAYMTLKQDQSRIKSCLADFLLGFGLMLPSENLCLSDDPEDCLAFEKVAIVGPDEFNAALLKSFTQINIKWVDTLAPHMEFDKATNTLFLFRYPSFCMASLPPEGKSTADNLLYW
jgi:hypothetical protein